MMCRIGEGFLLSKLDSHIVDYPTPTNLNYNWSFGSAAGLCLAIQIVTGMYLSMLYIGDAELAFFSIEYIMRDINNGWLLRYVHANGASFFFFSVYCHVFRGLYYGSYKEPRQALWWSGALLFFLTMATAFLGYVLPWGQMSFWAATVISQMITIVPIYGKKLLHWIWGAWFLGTLTLKRFYTLHFALPFVLVALVIVHLALLHADGSNNPLGITTKTSNVNFYPYFYVKDLLSFFVLLGVLSLFVFYYPNTLLSPINYIQADSEKTPDHVIPEWYFLAFYAVLRTIPHKTGGILAMFGAIALIFVHPIFDVSSVRSGNFRPFYAFAFWAFVSSLMFLAFSGSLPHLEEPASATCLPTEEEFNIYALSVRVLTIVYFSTFVLIGLAGPLDEFFSHRVAGLR